MRAAAYLAGAVIALGMYLLIAASFVFGPGWIGIGMLVIASATSIAMMAASPSHEA